MLRTGNADIATFFISILVGAGLCLIYDLFRIIRLANKPTLLTGFVQDVLYFFIAAIITFFNVLIRCDGEIRWFLLLGQLVGLIVCRLTLSRLVMAVSKSIIRFIKTVISLINQLIFVPLNKLMHWIKAILWKLFGGTLKKIHNLLKKCLKPLCDVLYNTFIKFFRSNKKLEEDS